MELHRETGSFNDKPIFFGHCAVRWGRAASERRYHPREWEQRRSKELRASARGASRLFLLSRAGQRSPMPSAMSRSCRTSGGTPRLTVRPFQGVLRSLPVTRHVFVPRLRLQQHHKRQRKLRGGLQASKSRLRATTCARHVSSTACTG